ncbi:MAG TPA: hypothetical protein PJ991_02215 [Kiritimatiellia bacterium]|nr:hypothetical protein [Kiritimatiellia bacterium]
MKTVARVSWIHEADALRMRLNSYGIEVFIPDESVVTADPILGNAVGGIRIQVRDEDYEESVEILGQKIESAEDSELVCPECGSSDIFYEKMSRQMFFIGILLLGIPFLVLKQNYCCRVCGATWK